MSTTELQQVKIKSPQEASSIFNNKSGAIQKPIVLIPNYATVWKSFYNVPSGMWVLHQKWHAHSGMKEPGLIPLWTSNNRISHIVTKQSVTFSAPVKMCPTSDNVMVNIDISINFQIGPKEDDVVNFVYSLGAHGLNELLRQQTEEAIRGLVNSVRHDQVHDLREDFAIGMKTDLNDTLNKFGVVVHNVKVTNVDLPQELSSTLEATTAFQTKMEEQEKAHENDIRNILNEESKILTTIQKTNERKILDLKAEKERLLLLRSKLIIEERAKAEVEEANLAAQLKAQLHKYEAAKNISEAKSLSTAAKSKNTVEVALAQTRIECARRIENAKFNASTLIATAEKYAVAELAKADAEEYSAKLLKERREFELAKKEIQMKMKLARKSNFVIKGEMGEALIRDICGEKKGTKLPPIRPNNKKMMKANNDPAVDTDSD